MARDDILVAKVGAVFNHGDQRVVIKKGITTVRRGHALLRGRENLFEPFEITFDLPVEAAASSKPEKAPERKAPRKPGA